MKNFMRILLTICCICYANVTKAVVIDFISLIESPWGYGESAWNPLSLSVGGANLYITGHASTDNDPTQYAYLDWGRAGLGVCKDANPAQVNVAYPNSRLNRCNPSSDDNVTTGEYLRFVFDRSVTINNLWFNNNHDGGFGPGDKVTIDGNAYAVSTGYASGPNGIGSFTVNAWQSFDIAYNNEEFYVDGLELNVNVAEPSSILIFSLGLVALVGIRRKYM